MDCVYILPDNTVTESDWFDDAVREGYIRIPDPGVRPCYEVKTPANTVMWAHPGDRIYKLNGEHNYIVCDVTTDLIGIAAWFTSVGVDIDSLLGTEKEKAKTDLDICSLGYSMMKEIENGTSN